MLKRILVHINVGSGWDVGLQSYLLKHRRTRDSSARAVPASDTIRGQRRQIPPRPNESSDDPSAALKGKVRVDDQKNCAHPSHFDIHRSLLRPYLSYVGSGWDCCVFAHDLFLASVGLQNYLLKHRRTRGSSARSVPISDTNSWLETADSNVPNLTTSRQSPQHCTGITLVSTTCSDRGRDAILL